MKYRLSQVQSTRDDRGSFAGVGFNIVNEGGSPIVTFGYLDEGAVARGADAEARRGRKPAGELSVANCSGRLSASGQCQRAAMAVAHTRVGQGTLTGRWEPRPGACPNIRGGITIERDIPARTKLWLTGWT